MGGDLHICLFANKQRIGASACIALPCKPEAFYKLRFQSAEDMGESENCAYEEQRKFKTLQMDGGVVIAKKLQDLMADWIEKSWLEKLNSSLGKPSLPSLTTL